MESTCPTCGRSLDAHNRHVRFRLPDPVLALPDQERTTGTWMSHATAVDSVMMQVPNVGPFVRALLPVQLKAGGTITFGLWLAVHPDDLQRAFRDWWSPDYASLVLDGYLANDVQPWGLLARPAQAIVRDPDQTPYIASSRDPETHAVLSEEWEHELVIDALPASLR